MASFTSRSTFDLSVPQVRLCGSVPRIEKQGQRPGCDVHSPETMPDREMELWNYRPSGDEVLPWHLASRRRIFNFTGGSNGKHVISCHVDRICRVRPVAVIGS